MDWEKELTDIDRLIREGDGDEAHRRLLRWTEKKVPAAHRAEVAWLSWRTDLPTIGLRLLNPIVRPSHRKVSQATPREKVEYAACLVKLGATEEAMRLLAEKELERLPETKLYLSFALANRWRYSAMIPLLSEYIQEPRINDYQRLIGSINLASALVFERKHQASAILLQQLLEQTSRSGARFARGKVMELIAGDKIYQRKFGEVEKFLSEAPEFSMERWRAVLDLLTGNSDRGTLDRARERALAANKWETLRDLDRFEAVATGNEAIAAKVFFGTPYQSFRKRFTSELPRAVTLPDAYLWRPLEGKPKATLDVETGETKKGRIEKNSLRLLKVLASDLYRPFRLAELHALSYPGDFFNPASSPARIHRAIQRLRKEFRSRALPLTVREDEGLYRIAALAAVELRLSLKAEVEGLSAELRLLKKFVSKDSFTLKEAAEKLELSARSTLRLLDEARKSGDLSRDGKGPSTKYRFVA